MTYLKNIRRYGLTCVLMIGTAVVSTLPLLAHAELSQPLLMEGKQSIFQRVLTRPGAQIVANPGDQEGIVEPAFSRFYVYDRRDVGGREWLLLGGKSSGETSGWMAADACLPWKQQMALAFTNPANRKRALLFKDREALMNVALAEDPGLVAEEFRSAGASEAGHPDVVAIEPETHIDITENFYLLPILGAEEVATHQGYRRVLQVASVTAKSTAATELPVRAETDSSATPAAVAEQSLNETDSQTPDPDALKAFSSALVFVIDSTISMGPYIDRTREAVRQVFESIEQAGVLNRVKFGFVAYRSNIEAAPGLEYVTRVFVNPSGMTGANDFLDKVASLRPATVSSPRFDEDAFAGVMAALDTFEWNSFGGRYLVLITDAGALDGNSPLSSTKLGAAQVRIEAEQRGVAIYTLHLRTPQGSGNHQTAERQYTSLTTNPIVGRPLYYGVDAGSVEEFGRIVEVLAESIVEQVKGASAGQMAASGGYESPDSGSSAESHTITGGMADRIRSDSALVTYAMQLAYLGRAQGIEAPDLFEAWLSDRDFSNPEIPTTEVRVLLTKNELSNLRDVVQAILDAGEQDQEDTSTADFFDTLRSSAAHLARDPNQITNPEATKLSELGLLGEYLDDLPYRSDVMNLTSDLWEQWSTSQQQDFLDSLRRKLRHYQIYHDDVDRWITLNTKGDAADHVYPIPIQALP